MGQCDIVFLGGGQADNKHYIVNPMLAGYKHDRG